MYKGSPLKEQQEVGARTRTGYINELTCLSALFEWGRGVCSNKRYDVCTYVADIYKSKRKRQRRNEKDRNIKLLSRFLLLYFCLSSPLSSSTHKHSSRYNELLLEECTMASTYNIHNMRHVCIIYYYTFTTAAVYFICIVSIVSS